MKIVRTTRYEKDIKRLRVTRYEQAKLEQAIATNPQVGDVVPGLDGARKVRFGFGGRGKRGGGRAVYFLLVADDTAIMLTAYSKSEQSDLTQHQKDVILTTRKEMEND